MKIQFVAGLLAAIGLASGCAPGMSKQHAGTSQTHNKVMATPEKEPNTHPEPRQGVIRPIGAIQATPLTAESKPLTEGDYTFTTNMIGQATIIQFNRAYCGPLLIANTLGGCLVTTIGKHAFQGHVGLTRVTIPDSVTCIETGAFENCTGLTRVTIPDSVNNVGPWAFYHTGLTKVTIGCGFTNNWLSTFFGCTNMEEITVADGNPVYSSLDGVLFNRSRTELIQFPEARAGNYAIPSSVTNIGHRAFRGCRGLIALTTPDNVTCIGTGAFSKCISLTNVMIGSGVTRIGDMTFSSCAHLQDITVAKDNSAYSSMDGVLFDKGQAMLIQCPAGKEGSYVIPDSVTCIGEMAFSYCSNLVSVTIPDSVTNIGLRAFSGCTGLTNLPVEAGIPQAAAERRMSYAQRRAERQKMRQQSAPMTAPKYTGEELEKYLHEHQMELIRQGLPPLPLPLTKEMDDQLVKEGVLPPVGGGQYEPFRYKSPTNTPQPKLYIRSETNK